VADQFIGCQASQQLSQMASIKHVTLDRRVASVVGKLQIMAVHTKPAADRNRMKQQLSSFCWVASVVGELQTTQAAAATQHELSHNTTSTTSDP
jgi:hypothetical protein